MVNKDFEYSWSDLGRSLHSPAFEFQAKSDEEYEEDYRQLVEEQPEPDIVALHDAPTDQESLRRYEMVEDHACYLDKLYEGWKGTVLIPDNLEAQVKETKNTWLEDLGIETANYDIELETFWDDFEGIGNQVDSDATVHTVSSDYCRKRVDWIADKSLDADTFAMGVETGDIGRDSGYMRVLEFGKRIVERSPPLRNFLDGLIG